MGALRRADVEAALEVVETVCESREPHPFALETLRRLGVLVRADVATGYCESWVSRSFSSYELVTRPPPPWLQASLDACGQEDPTHAVHCHAAVASVAISDFLTARAFTRLAIYNEICRPLNVADSLRLYLPAGPGGARFFFFDRSTRGFDRQTRTLLEVLRPHLARARARWKPPVQGLPLTRRQREILRWVAEGRTNEEIAGHLWISEHTVRKHLENINRRLGVHSRAAAAVAYATGYPTAAEAGPVGGPASWSSPANDV
jgi:DNA-binding CsgD family transcriptional regulator